MSNSNHGGRGQRGSGGAPRTRPPTEATRDQWLHNWWSTANDNPSQGEIENIANRIHRPPAWVADWVRNTGLPQRNHARNALGLTGNNLPPVQTAQPAQPAPPQQSRHINRPAYTALHPGSFQPPAPSVDLHFGEPLEGAFGTTHRTFPPGGQHPPPIPPGTWQSHHFHQQGPGPQNQQDQQGQPVQGQGQGWGQQQHLGLQQGPQGRGQGQGFVWGPAGGQQQQHGMQPQGPQGQGQGRGGNQGQGRGWDGQQRGGYGAPNQRGNFGGWGN